MAKRDVSLRMDLSGPFFTRDPRRTVKQNIREMMGRLADETEGDIRRAIAARRGAMPRSAGKTLGALRGRNEALSGKDWYQSMVVSVDTSRMDRQQAIATKAAAMTIERRWRPFRRATSTIRRSRAILAANLTKGLE